MAMTTEARKRVFKRWAIAIAFVGLILMPGVHLLLTWLNDDVPQILTSTLVANDISGLERTSIEGTWIPGSNAEAVQSIQDMLRFAETRDLAVSIAGARHRQGGHTIAPGGIQLDLGA
jgi:hypothetical protein